VAVEIPVKEGKGPWTRMVKSGMTEENLWRLLRLSYFCFTIVASQSSGLIENNTS
jgi:hypothetical protein